MFVTTAVVFEEDGSSILLTRLIPVCCAISPKLMIHLLLMLGSHIRTRLVLVPSSFGCEEHFFVESSTFKTFFPARSDIYTNIKQVEGILKVPTSTEIIRQPTPLRM